MTNQSLTTLPLAYLSPWLEDVSQARVESLGVTGGLSGAVIWRVKTGDRVLCLRRWPQAHPSLTGLLAIHGLIRHVAATGFSIVPVPLATCHDETYFVHEDHLWELTPWMPGMPLLRSQPSAETLATAMRALARFHLAAENYDYRGEAACRAPSPGLRQRLSMLQGLQQGELRQLWQATRTAQPSDLREMAFELLEGLDRSLNAVASNLLQVAEVPLPLQWCLRDVRHDHILFDGDRVSGILDFGAVAVDSVAGDLARLLGSIVINHPSSWHAAIEAYEQVRPLAPAERRGIVCFDEGGLLCSATNWVRWLFVEGRSFPQIHALHAQLVWLRDRLQSLAVQATASVAQPLAGPSWSRASQSSSTGESPQSPSATPWMHT